MIFPEKTGDDDREADIYLPPLGVHKPGAFNEKEIARSGILCATPHAKEKWICRQKRMSVCLICLLVCCMDSAGGKYVVILSSFVLVLLF